MAASWSAPSAVRAAPARRTKFPARPARPPSTASRRANSTEDDHALFGERVDLPGAVPDPQQQLPRAFADRGRLVAHRQALAVQFERQRRRAERRAARIAHFHQPARGIQVRVVEQVLRPGDGRVGQADRFQLFLQVGALPALEHHAQARDQPLALPDALRIGFQPRVRAQFPFAELAAEYFPLRIGDHADEQPVVAGFEYVVDAPGRFLTDIGGGASPVMAYCAMCCPTRNTVFSNSALFTSLPRPVSSRSRSAARMPMAANMPPMMSFTDEPTRSGRSGRPVM